MIKHKTLSPGLWGLTVLLIVLTLGIAGCDFIDPDDQGPSSDGLHPVLIDGFWGFINAQGRIMIAPSFESVGAFSDGLAAVQRGADWGYIDPEGVFVIAPQFQFAGAYVEGLAPVRGQGFNASYGFINPAGTVVIEARYDLALAFSEGLAAVRLEGQWGYVDKKEGRDGHPAAVQRCPLVRGRPRRRRRPGRMDLHRQDGRGGDQPGLYP